MNYKVPQDIIKNVPYVKKCGKNASETFAER